MFRSGHAALLEERVDLETRPLNDAHRATHLVFVDPTSVALRRLLDRIAPSDAPVLISGETGTGKELVARHIHRKSGRKGPFLAVNCGAIAEHLAESELFGHEAGSFTGAGVRREGWFEAANGGTLFLDEIGDMPMPLQVKVLRVLQEHEVTRVGSRKSVAVDVRIIAASNVNLAEAVDSGQFRSDLFYRLNIVPIQIPALRSRPQDIIALAGHFCGTYAARLKRSVPALTQDATDKLKAHSWPGNIRELENVIHYTMLTCNDDVVRAEDIRLSQPSGSVAVAIQAGASPDHKFRAQLKGVLDEYFRSPGATLLRDVEHQVVEGAFRVCASNQVKTAELLGVTRNVVRTLLKRYGLIDETTALADGGAYAD